jgi:hypothetical protein
MTGRVDITNRALQAIGTRSTIASMQEGSNESNNANLCYDATRQELIRSAPWNFCTATMTLALLKSAPGTAENPTYPANTAWNGNTQPPPGWSFEYAYPNDCLQARKVVSNVTPATYGASQVPLFPFGATNISWQGGCWEWPGQRFQVTTDLDASNNPFTCILTNVDQAILCYLRDITVESVWDPLFTEAMVLALGGKLALALTTDKQIADMAFKKANERIMAARAADGNEGVTVMDHMPDWITRGHGLSGHRGYSGDYTLPYGSLFGGY